MSAMPSLHGSDTDTTHLWQNFATQEQLTEAQLQQFKTYADELVAWNEKFNLTSILTTRGIISYHFQDSLELGRLLDMSKLTSFCDVGSGAGFPGIPLKIKYPHLRVALVEVNNKKLSFLRHIIECLGLEGIEVYDLDWRTFLRTTYDQFDLFGTRASLELPELFRLFKPGCHYTDAPLVYWASEQWEPDAVSATFMRATHAYHFRSRKRQLIFFGKQPRANYSFLTER